MIYWLIIYRLIVYWLIVYRPTRNLTQDISSLPANDLLVISLLASGLPAN
jgi:hypothetical protein